MCRYIFAFRLDEQGDDIFVRFPKFPEIISAIPRGSFETMGPRSVIEHAQDAVLTALQARILTREDIPNGDDTRLRADGFVRLSVPQAMKLELFKLYKVNCRSVADFARQIGKKETAARRLLDLRHPSWPSEIEGAFEVFGRSLVHDWHADVSYNVPPPASALSLDLR